MAHGLAVTVCDEQQPVRIVYAGGEALASVLTWPIDVDAGIPSPGIFSEQRAAALDEPVHVRVFSSTNYHCLPSITHGPRRYRQALTTRPKCLPNS